MPKLNELSIYAPPGKPAPVTRGSPDRLCAHCRRVAVREFLVCSACYERSAEGRASKRHRQLLSKYVPLNDGGPCAPCKHWNGTSLSCGLGLPEGGSTFATDCPAMCTSEDSL